LSTRILRVLACLIAGRTFVATPGWGSRDADVLDTFTSLRSSGDSGDGDAAGNDRRTVVRRRAPPSS